VDDRFIRRVRDFVRGFPQTLADVTRLLNRNRIFIDRTRGIGVLTRDEAINHSCSGPIARASGVVRDLRKDEPYLAYPDFDFQVVCAREGDCYARYLVRIEEMRESLKIVEQAIENLPSGPVNVDVESKAVLPDPQACYRSIEALIQHFELIMPNRQWQAPRDEVYGAIESPNGELGFYLVADGTGKAYRARTRPPSFIHFAIFPHLIVGHQLSDVVAVLGSLNIIAAELDR
jgi:NADH-quinone oxidoreductase subunit D